MSRAAEHMKTADTGDADKSVMMMYMSNILLEKENTRIWKVCEQMLSEVENVRHTSCVQLTPASALEEAFHQSIDRYRISARQMELLIADNKRFIEALDQYADPVEIMDQWRKYKLQISACKDEQERLFKETSGHKNRILDAYQPKNT